MTDAKVVIVGGGFAGINAAKKLGNQKNLHVTLVDQRNHHLFQPLLYQVATGSLNPADIAMPIRSILWQYKNIDVVLSHVNQVDFERRRVVTHNSELPYDYLIVACGSSHSYFGHDEWEADAPALKTLEDAIEIRRRVLLAFEMAEQEQDAEKRQAWLTFVVVGAGPTGVELAGALGELRRHTLRREFHHIDTSRARIFLVEAGPRVLPMFDKSLAESARKELEKLAIQVLTGQPVTTVRNGSVELGPKKIVAQTILWAAGVKAATLNQGIAQRVEVDRAGRVIVQPDLRVSGHQGVFLVGDQASLIVDGKVLPQLAPVAIQQGKHAAENILRLHAGQETQPFRYFDKGQMATIGRASAITQVGSLKMKGLIAWLAWCFVHILYLIGFRNRLLVLIQWMWSYFGFKRGTRIMTAENWKPSTSRSVEAGKNSDLT